MSVGSVLAEKREKLGLDVESMATYLRIRLPYLKAIENDDFDQLPPGNAYRVGFIKSYAMALEVDVDQIVALYHKEQGGAPKNVPLRVRVPIKDGHGSTFGLLGVLAAVLIAGWIAFAWLHHSGDRKIADEVAPVPDRLQPQAEVAAAVPDSARTQIEQQAAAESDEARDEAYAAPKTAEAPARPAAIPGAGTAYAAGEGPSRVEIDVLADTWMQIKNGETTVYTGVLHAGDTYKIPDQPGWTMTAGNAAGVVLALDGHPGSPLGPEGAVIRDIPLGAAIVASKQP